MFKDLYTGSPWSLLCSSCRILQSVFYAGSKVYWGKMRSVLWPAPCAKGREREELFCGPLQAMRLSWLLGITFDVPAVQTHIPTLIPASWSRYCSVTGPSHLPLSQLDSQELGASSSSGSQVPLGSKFCSWRVSPKPYFFITLFPFQSKSAAVYKCLTGTYLPYACLRSSRKGKGN